MRRIFSAEVIYDSTVLTESPSSFAISLFDIPLATQTTISFSLSESCSSADCGDAAGFSLLLIAHVFA